VRALGDVQRRGLEAARSIVDGFIAALDGGTSSGATEQSDGDASRPDAADLIALWEQLARGAIDVVAGLARVSASTVTGRGDVRLTWSTTPVRVVVDRAGGSQTGTSQVWLHHDGAANRSALRPHFGELRSAEGTVLDATVTFEPPVVDIGGGSSSQSLLLRVATTDPAATPGTYRGLAFVDGVPDTWLVVEVLVTS
jgi:hypothetical protein